ncbi:MAG: hypothetical protein NC311_12625 [Muribaculaceae bacterium]|nr:hypothetical protein [Muribaculaceae bacterium]
MKKLLSSLLSALTVSLLFILSACSQPSDTRLLEAERLMESHPDSALMLLEDTHLSANASEYNRHLYNMLLIYAKYKNYIDEDNDSTITETALFFIDNGNKKYATEALYLSGTIQLNIGKIGEAAVSFSKGLEIAKSIKDRFWEGQCARGLFILHGKILNSSAQLQYARQEYDSFISGNYQEWIPWSRLDIATALSNNGQYKRGLTEATNLLNETQHLKDSLLTYNTLILIATIDVAFKNYENAIDKYVSAYSMYSNLLSNNDLNNLADAVKNTDKTKLSQDTKNMIDKIFTNYNYHYILESFDNEHNYRNAYKTLKQYKDEQDSIITSILHNNVSESLNHYLDTQESIRKVKQLNERYIWILILLGSIVTATCIIVILRKDLEKKDQIKRKIEEDMENLKKDFSLLLEKKKVISESFRNYIIAKYDSIDTLCDNYYEKRVSYKTNNKLASQINDIVAEFNDKKFLEKVSSEVDSYTEGLFSSFKSHFPDIKDETLKLYLYLMLGFGTRTISVIMNQDPTIIYNRKSRLKAKIRESNIERKEEHLQLL